MHTSLLCSLFDYSRISLFSFFFLSTSNSVIYTHIHMLSSWVFVSCISSIVIFWKRIFLVIHTRDLFDFLFENVLFLSLILCMQQTLIGRVFYSVSLSLFATMMLSLSRILALSMYMSRPSSMHLFRAFSLRVFFNA